MNTPRSIEQIRASLRANLADLRSAGVDLTMAFGVTSSVFTVFERDVHQNTASHNPDVDADSLKIALYGNSGTPDKTVADTLTGYNQSTSQWVTANEVTATGWPAGGLALASVTSAASGATYTIDAADRAGGASDTVTNAYGALVYDDTITTKDGLCFLAFGGANTVTGGTFTVQFAAAGVMTVGT